MSRRNALSVPTAPGNAFALPGREGTAQSRAVVDGAGIYTPVK